MTIMRTITQFTILMAILGSSVAHAETLCDRLNRYFGLGSGPGYHIASNPCFACESCTAPGFVGPSPYMPPAPSHPVPAQAGPAVPMGFQSSPAARNDSTAQ